MSTISRATAAARAATVAVLVAVAALLTGCSAPADPYAECLEGTGTEPASALVVAVAVHQGAPAPGLPESVVPLLTSTLAAGNPVRVVGIDGTPALVPVPAPQKLATKNCDAYRRTLQNTVAAVLSTVRGASADSDGNDLYGAISLSADVARDLDESATVLVLDSGLADRGPLDYTRTGMTVTDPEELAAFVAENQPVDLSGLSFQLLLGNTASPQEPLSGTERANVAATWATTLTALGAEDVSTHATARPAEGPETTYTVGLAPVAEIDPFDPPTKGRPTTVVFDEDAIEFHPNSNVLVRKKSAAKAVREITAWLAADPSRHIEIVGTTANVGPEEGQRTRSAQRAETIKNLVLDTPGVDADRIRTRGVGSDFDEYVDDHRPDGTLDPVKAARNRTVRITAYQE